MALLVHSSKYTIEYHGISQHDIIDGVHTYVGMQIVIFAIPAIITYRSYEVDNRCCAGSVCNYCPSQFDCGNGDNNQYLE